MTASEETPPTLWSCVGWRVRPTPWKTFKVLGGAIFWAVVAVVAGAYAAKPGMGCTDDPPPGSIPPGTYPQPCTFGPARRPQQGVRVPMPGRPGWLIASIAIAVAVIVGSVIYLLWRRKPNHLQWAEFDRKASELRATVQQRYTGEPTPANERAVQQLDAEYAEISAKYKPQPPPSGTPSG